jgi:hypothetical protein
LLERDLRDAHANWNAAYRDISKLEKNFADARKNGLNLAVSLAEGQFRHNADVAYYKAALADVLSAVEEEHKREVDFVGWCMFDGYRDALWIHPTVRAYHRYAR